MRLEDLAVNLRPRTPWEASDLGALMYRQWWPATMRAWLAVYGPATIVLFAACYRQPWVAMFILWWLKPLFDRFALHVLSRAVFGAVPTVGQTLGAWREILRDGLWADLTYRRISMRRSFRLPITQLEGPSSKSVSERASVLGQRVGAHAAAITLACVIFEVVAVFALEGLVEFFTPDDPRARPFSLLEWARGTESQRLFEPVDMLYYAAAVSLIEPLYVAQGFALYMVRRTLLEGWDIEIGFRRIANRLAARSINATMLALALTCSSVGDVHAQPTASSLHLAREQIQEVMGAPEFERYREVTTWQWKGSRTGREERETPKVLQAIGEALAEIARVMAWIAAAGALVALVWSLRRFIRSDMVGSGRSSYRAPAAVSGLDVRPESFPADIPAEARALAANGAVREALSLLYRGALSVLVHQRQLQLRPSDTEIDCLRAAQPVLSTQAHEFMQTLIESWRDCAYAQRVPAAAPLEHLIAGWETHLGHRAAVANPSAPPPLREANA